MKHIRGAQRGIRHPGQVLHLQLVLLVLVTGIAWQLEGPAAAEAAFWGVLIALANTGLLMWRMRRGEQGAAMACRPLAGAYRSSLERFALVALLLGLGLAGMGLEPLALTAGFVVGQLGWFIAPLLRGADPEGL
ncbi:ATP synthase subunit I [Thiobacter aerophilum]|uniref:ATP synthase subunit I n=1 Tax=Thiobacter aerophilum TaxID=3121275 RepID=A0ABV0EDL5_9BURK